MVLLQAKVFTFVKQKNTKNCNKDIFAGKFGEPNPVLLRNFFGEEMVFIISDESFKKFNLKITKEL